MKRFLLTILLSLPCFAATYYVSPTGNDSNAGSAAAPWLTLNRAVPDHASDPNVDAGDTVKIDPGTYARMEYAEAGSTRSQWITYEANQPASWPTIQGVYIDDTPNAYIDLHQLNVVDPNNATYPHAINLDGSSTDGCSHVRVRDCNVTAPYREGTACRVYWTNNVEITDCNLHKAAYPLSVNDCNDVNALRCNLFDGGLDHLHLQDVRNSIFQQLEIHTNDANYYDGAGHRDTIQWLVSKADGFVNVTIDRCKIYDCDLAAGFYANGGVYEFLDCSFTNNVMWGNYNVHIFQLYDANNFDLIGNTFYDRGTSSIEFKSDCTSVISANNIAQGLAFYVVGTTGMTSVNNILNNTWYQAGSQDASESALEGLDPGFSDAANNDFSLVADANAVGAGTATYTTTYDYLGVTRGSPPDIGAYEYVAAASTPYLRIVITGP